jgi:hypothetical protein
MAAPKLLTENITKIVLAIIASGGALAGAYFGPDAMDSIQLKEVAVLEHQVLHETVKSHDAENDREVLRLKLDMAIQLIDFRLDYIQDKIIRFKEKPTLTVREQRELDMATSEYTHQQDRKQKFLDQR